MATWPDNRPLPEVSDAIERYREILGEELIQEARRILGEQGGRPSGTAAPSAEVG